MAEIKNTNVKNHVEIRNGMKDGSRIEYIVIDGRNIGVMGSMNEADREAAIKVLNDAYNASEGNIMKMIGLITNIANDDSLGIRPDEIISVDGIDFEIEYATKKAYTLDGEEVANCEDINCKLDNEAVRAILESRIKVWIDEMSSYENEEDLLERFINE